MTDFKIAHDQDIHGPACENCHLFRIGCPARAAGHEATPRSVCAKWEKRQRGPKKQALAALTGIAYRPRSTRPPGSD